MSTPNDLRDLAIRITRLPGWRWMPGMWVRPIDHQGPPERIMYEDEAARMNARPGNVDEWRVDLADPATAGCLLALLGENRATRGAVFVLVEATHARTLGEACARAALALGRWPGGVE